MFNTLKKDYRMSNLYTMEEITDSFANVNTNITVYYSDDNRTIEFSDWVALLNTLYHKKIDSPWCSAGHVFTVCHDNPGKLVIHTDNLKTKSHTQDMIRRKRKHTLVDRKRLIAKAVAQLKRLDHVGLTNIKKLKWAQSTVL